MSILNAYEARELAVAAHRNKIDEALDEIISTVRRAAHEGAMSVKCLLSLRGQIVLSLSDVLEDAGYEVEARYTDGEDEDAVEIFLKWRNALTDPAKST